MELGPDELIDVSSDLMDVFRSSIGPLSPGTQRMVVSPSVQSERRKLHLKLTFVLGEHRVEFPFVEFAVSRSGSEEVEIQSCSSALPLKMTITLNHVDGTGQFNAKYYFAGKEARVVFKARQALRIFTAGGQLRIFDLDTENSFTTLTGRQTGSPPTERDHAEDELISDLHEIVLALNDDITWPTAITMDDAISVQLLREAVRKGRVSVPVESITVGMPLADWTNADISWRHSGCFITAPTEPAPFATVFGKQFDLGSYTVSIMPRSLAVNAPPDQPEARVLEIVLAQPLIYKFDKFIKT
jgi:hypothetical protein